MTDKEPCVVAFDTSNYTTSVAVCALDGRIVVNRKILLRVRDGECGLRQSDAVFLHTKNLPIICDMLAEDLKAFSPVAVGVSATPRRVPDSYMPCFACGIAAAHSFAASRALPVYQTSHQHGHIMAAMYSSGKTEKLMRDRFLAFHVSGGTTEALLITPNNNRDDFDIRLVGQTMDINAGQAIDRAGVMMGLSFPCGRELEKLAADYSGKTEKHKVCVRDGNCCMSGIENIARKIYERTKDRNATAAVVFDFICETLVEMSGQLLDKYGNMPILYAGGVMSNKIMRDRLSAQFDAGFAEPEFSSDNAAGVALLARLDFLRRNDEQFCLQYPKY